jgi:hypothetical protein
VYTWEKEVDVGVLCWVCAMIVDWPLLCRAVVLCSAVVTAALCMLSQSVWLKAAAARLLAAAVATCCSMACAVRKPTVAGC